MKNSFIKLKQLLWAANRLLQTPIAKKNKFRVIINILIFQIKKNISKKPFVFKTCTSTFAYTQKNIDTTGIAGLYYTGLIEASEILFAWHLLRPNDIFFDIGANQGAWGLVLCAKNIYCHEFEPSSETFQSLKKQISYNKNFKDYLLPHKLAISNKNGTIEFTIGRGLNNQIKSDFSVNTLKSSYEKVKVATLDSLAEKYGYPTIIKIDTEGFTNEVLEKGGKVLKHKSLKALIIETFRKYDFKTQRFIEMEKMLANNGFFPYFFDIKNRILSPITKPDEGDQDTIYIRNNEENLYLIKESKPLKIFNQYY